MLMDFTETEMKEFVLEEVEERIHQAGVYYGRSFEIPEVRFCRNVTRAGRGAGHEGWVEYNIGYLMSDKEKDRKDMIEETVPHEIAHVLVYIMHGRDAKPHGEEWLRMMRKVLCVEPVRTHSYCQKSARQTITRRPQRQWVYECGCCLHSVPTRKKNRIEENRRMNKIYNTGTETNWQCGKCEKPLMLIKELKR